MNAILSRSEADQIRTPERKRLFDRMIKAKREAEETETFAAFDYAGRCYRDFMRSYLDDAEQQVVALEDEILKLRAQLRGRR